MKRKSKRKQKHVAAKSVLRLPDLEVAKSAVLNSLSCPDVQRGYRHAIDELVEWYCSEPRLSFSKTVVVRYRMHLNLAISHQGRLISGSEPFVVRRPKKDNSFGAAALFDRTIP
jgi:hypothetical protein